MTRPLGILQQAALRVLVAHPEGVADIQRKLGEELNRRPYLPFMQTMKIMNSLVRRGLARRDKSGWVLVK